MIRRAVWLQLSASAAVMLSCGGATSPALVADNDAGTAADGASSLPPPEGDAETPGQDAGNPGQDAGNPGQDAGNSGHDAGQSDASPEGPTCTVIPGNSLAGGCGERAYPFDGTATQCGAGDAGQLPLDRCVALCPPMQSVALASCAILDCVDCAVGPTTILEIDCFYSQICGTGRRPAGLRRCKPRRARGAVAGYLAQMAYLEAASVDAFGRLERELEAHGAPRELLASARRARRDEVRHARVATALAERAGAIVPSPEVPRGPVRALENIAIENAVEGCVHETFGAAVTMVQAATAGDRAVRAAMRTIARDELRHAELSWSIARWLDEKLDDAARSRVRRARDDAGRALVGTMSREPPRELVEELGIPAARHAQAIARELRAAFWS